MNKNNKKGPITLVVLIAVFAALLIWSIIKQFDSGNVGTEKTPGFLYFIILATAILTFFFVRAVYLKLYPPKEKEVVTKTSVQLESMLDFEQYIKKETKIDIYDQDIVDGKQIETPEVEVVEEKEDENTQTTVVYIGQDEEEVEEKEIKNTIVEEVIENVIPIGDNDSRFYMLTQIDKRYETYKAPKYDKEITLKKLCDDFRAFSAGRLKLYYDIEDIRRFIAGLSVTKLIILQGMSGTGKTSLAYAFGEYLNNKTVVVPIQPMWKERTDLVGYYNEFTKK